MKYRIFLTLAVVLFSTICLCQGDDLIEWKSKGMGGGGGIESIGIDPQKYSGNTHIYVSSDTATVWKSENGGDSWIAITPAMGKNFKHYVLDWAFDTSTNPSTVYAATEREIFMSSDGGYAWDQISHQEGNYCCGQMYGAIQVISGDPVYILAGPGTFNASTSQQATRSKGRILRGYDTGSGFQWGITDMQGLDEYKGHCFASIVRHPQNSNVVFASGRGGIYRSTNIREQDVANVYWERIESGLPTQTAAYRYYDPVSEKWTNVDAVAAAKMDVVVTDYDSDSTEETLLYAMIYETDESGKNAGLYRGVIESPDGDGSINWEEWNGCQSGCNQLPATKCFTGEKKDMWYTVAIHPSNPETIFVGSLKSKTKGDVWRSTDEGKNWEWLCCFELHQYWCSGEEDCDGTEEDCTIFDRCNNGHCNEATFDNGFGDSEEGAGWEMQYSNHLETFDLLFDPSDQDKVYVTDNDIFVSIDADVQGRDNFKWRQIYTDRNGCDYYWKGRGVEPLHMGQAVRDNDGIIWAGYVDRRLWKSDTQNEYFTPFLLYGNHIALNHNTIYSILTDIISDGDIYISNVGADIRVLKTTNGSDINWIDKSGGLPIVEANCQEHPEIANCVEEQFASRTDRYPLLYAEDQSGALKVWYVGVGRYGIYRSTDLDSATCRWDDGPNNTCWDEIYYEGDGTQNLNKVVVWSMELTSFNDIWAGVLAYDRDSTGESFTPYNSKIIRSKNAGQTWETVFDSDDTANSNLPEGKIMDISFAECSDPNCVRKIYAGVSNWLEPNYLDGGLILGKELSDGTYEWEDDPIVFIPNGDQDDITDMVHIVSIDQVYNERMYVSSDWYYLYDIYNPDQGAGPQRVPGLFRTINGGQSWHQVDGWEDGTVDNSLGCYRFSNMWHTPDDFNEILLTTRGCGLYEGYDKGNFHAEDKSYSLTYVGKNKKAQVDMVIKNSHSETLAGATISGYWEYKGEQIGSTMSDITYNDGNITFVSPEVKKNPSGCFKFIITSGPDKYLYEYESDTGDSEICG